MLLTRRFVWQARWRALVTGQWRAWIGVVLFIGIGAILLTVAWLMLRAHASGLLAAMLAQPLVLVGCCAALASHVTMHGRRRQIAQFAQSWLAALALSPSQMRMAFFAPIAWRIALIWLAFASAVLVSASSVRIAVGSVFSLQVCVLLGTLAGALLGWRLGAEPRSVRQTRQAWGRARRAFARTDALSVLSHWPLVHARSRADPAFHARVVLPILLAMPVGIPLSAVIAILALCALALLLLELARALLVVVPIAVNWLRSTPLPAARLMRRLGLRTLVWFGVFLGLTLMLLIGGGLQTSHTLIFGGCTMLALLAGCLWRWPRLGST